MPRVLFVDDEELLLNIFDSLMENEEDAWESRKARDGEEAKLILDEWTCDLLVTDLRMPNLDGVALLEHAKEEYPEMTRVVLSGCSEASLLEKADRISHVRLEKPCRLEELRRTLNQSYRFNVEPGD